MHNRLYIYVPRLIPNWLIDSWKFLSLIKNDKIIQKSSIFANYRPPYRFSIFYEKEESPDTTEQHNG